MTDERGVGDFLRQSYRNGLLYPAAVIGSYYALLLLVHSFAHHLGFQEIAAVALTFVLLPAVLAPRAILRGLAAAALGVLFGTVGINTITGDVRFVFDQPSLWEGLPPLAVLLGLFAVPLAFGLMRQGQRDSNGLTIRGLALFAGVTLAALTIWLGARHLQWPALPVIAAFAGIGLLLNRHGWPRLPLFVGIVAGPVVEGNYLNALNVGSQLEFAMRPLNFALGVTVLAFAAASYRIANPGKPAVGEEATRRSLGTAALQWRNVVPLLGVATGIAFFWGSLGFSSVEAWLLVRLSATAVIALCVLQLFLNIRDTRIPSPDAADTGARTDRGIISVTAFVLLGYLGVVTIALAGALVAAAFHLRNADARGRNLLEQAASRLTLPSMKEALLPLAIGVVALAFLATVTGIQWGLAALAGTLPFLFMRGLSTRPSAAAVGAAIAGAALIVVARWSFDVTAVLPTTETLPPLGLSAWTEFQGGIAGLATYTLSSGYGSFGVLIGNLSEMLFFLHVAGVALISISLVLSAVWPAGSVPWNPILRVLMSWQTLASLIVMVVVLETVHTIVS